MAVLKRKLLLVKFSAITFLEKALSIESQQTIILLSSRTRGAILKSKKGELCCRKVMWAMPFTAPIFALVKKDKSNNGFKQRL